MLRFLPLILKNSLRNRRRTLLTVLSLGVSFCLLGFLLATYRVLFADAGDGTKPPLRLFTHNRVSLAQPMPVAYERRIENVPGVSGVTIWQWFGGSYKDARDPKNFFLRIGVEPAKIFHIWTELQIPDEQRQAFERTRTACVAAKALADKFGWKPGDRITLVGDIFPGTFDFQLAGTFDDPDHVEMLLFNIDYVFESLPAGIGQRDATGAFLVRVAAPEDAPAVAHAIDAMFENSPAATMTETERAYQLSFVAFLGNLEMFLMALGGAVTFTILLVSANTFSMSVRERIPEIGVLKTLGFTPGKIMAITLAEAAVVGAGGGILGCGLAGLVCAAIRRAPAGIQLLKSLSVTPAIAGLTVSAAMVLGLAGALVPAIRGSRLSVVQSLRFQG